MRQVYNISKKLSTVETALKTQEFKQIKFVFFSKQNSNISREI